MLWMFVLWLGYLLGLWFAFGTWFVGLLLLFVWLSGCYLIVLWCSDFMVGFCLFLCLCFGILGL